MDATVTPLICSECGEGNYRYDESFTFERHCTHCEHTLAARDFELDEGESLSIVDGLLCLVSA